MYSYVTTVIESNAKDLKYSIGLKNLTLLLSMTVIHVITTYEMFYFQIYVDENHRIGSYLQNRHLFLAMTDFLTKKCFHI